MPPRSATEVYSQDLSNLSKCPITFCYLCVGLQDRLDHFEYLGVEAVWLSPIYRSPMVDFGYDVSEYRDVDPTFGTMSDLESFIAAAQRKGL